MGDGDLFYYSPPSEHSPSRAYLDANNNVVRTDMKCNRGDSSSWNKPKPPDPASLPPLPSFEGHVTDGIYNYTKEDFKYINLDELYANSATSLMHARGVSLRMRGVDHFDESTYDDLDDQAIGKDVLWSACLGLVCPPALKGCTSAPFGLVYSNANTNFTITPLYFAASVASSNGRSPGGTSSGTKTDVKPAGCSQACRRCRKCHNKCRTRKHKRRCRNWCNNQRRCKKCKRC